MTHVPYLEPTNIGRHHIEVSHSRNLAAGICTPLRLQYQTAYK